MYFGEVAAGIKEMKTILGRKPKPSDVEALTWTMGLLGHAFTAGEFVKAMREWVLPAEQWVAFTRNMTCILHLR